MDTAIGGHPERSCSHLIRRAVLTLLAEGRAPPLLHHLRRRGIAQVMPTRW